MNEESLTISQIYAKGKENLRKIEYTMGIPPDSNIGASVRANRKYLDSLFLQLKFFDR